MVLCECMGACVNAVSGTKSLRKDNRPQTEILFLCTFVTELNEGLETYLRVRAEPRADRGAAESLECQTEWVGGGGG